MTRADCREYEVVWDGRADGPDLLPERPSVPDLRRDVLARERADAIKTLRIAVARLKDTHRIAEGSGFGQMVSGAERRARGAARGMRIAAARGRAHAGRVRR